MIKEVVFLDKKTLFYYTLRYKVICKGKQMSEKEEALQHLSEIKSALVDKDSFFPYNYNALVVWGVIGMVMPIVMPGLLKSSVLQGTIFSILLMSVGFVVEGFLTKRVNKDYDIESCTKKQHFIAMTYTIMTLFAIALSALLAKYHLIIPVFAIWMFVCGVGDFAVGFVLNIKLFTHASYIMIGMSLLILILAYFIEDLGDLESAFFFFAQGMTFATLGVLPIMIARKLQKES